MVGLESMFFGWVAIMDGHWVGGHSMSGGLCCATCKKPKLVQYAPPKSILL